MIKYSFSILITTKNRFADLVFTLKKIENLLHREDVECIICDDGSTDNTAEYLKKNHPQIKVLKNEKSKGLIYSRNRLLDMTTADFAISLDDDAHFITDNPLELIQNYFENNSNCAVLGFRIFWSLNGPFSINTNEKPHRVKGFVGCAHVWRMSSWRTIANYPEWFVFYGEEDFASYQLFKKDLQIHYLPEVLVNHRVDLKSRKNNEDYTERLHKSLRAGWYLFFMFYPLQKIPRIFIYSIWMQLKLKVFKGDLNALKALGLAFFDLILNFPKIIKYSNRLSMNDFKELNQLQSTKIYWQEENKYIC